MSGGEAANTRGLLQRAREEGLKAVEYEERKVQLEGQGKQLKGEAELRVARAAGGVIAEMIVYKLGETLSRGKEPEVPFWCTVLSARVYDALQEHVSIDWEFIEKHVVPLVIAKEPAVSFIEDPRGGFRVLIDLEKL